MKELVSVLKRLRCSNVSTYIQSGNAVFGCAEADGSKLSSRIAKAIHSSHGFEPRVLLLSYEQFRTAITRCPFQPTEAEYRTVHVFFLFEPAAQPDCEGMAAIRAEDENYLLKRNAFYLQTPSGIGTSKLAGRVERLLGVEATARNWRTVERIFEMATDATGNSTRPLEGDE